MVGSRVIPALHDRALHRLWLYTYLSLVCYTYPLHPSTRPIRHTGRNRVSSLALVSPPDPQGLPPEGAILPAQKIREMVARGEILNTGSGVAALTSDPTLSGRLQPAGLDLRLGTRAWRVRASFLPSRRSGVRDTMEDFVNHEISLTKGTVLETGGVYIAEIQESLALPHGIGARASAKSSVGRLNLFTRLISEHGPAFDEVEAGYRGALYVEIAPNAFPVFVQSGLSLNQLRLLANKPQPQQETEIHVDLSGRASNGLAGYRAQRYTDVIDLTRTGEADPRGFWDTLPARPDGRLVLDPNAFYILVSEPEVCVDPQHAGELFPYEAGMGEFRVHYAGFFDPGFGYDAEQKNSNKAKGARAVLEVRSHEVPFVLEHGQAVGRLMSYPLSETSEQGYDRRAGPSYRDQGLTLSRYFAPWV